MLRCRCPLWVISGHTDKLALCPLYPSKRTCSESVAMSAKCHKRTSGFRLEATSSPGKALLLKRQQAWSAAVATPDRFIAWCKQEQASIEQQLELLQRVRCDRRGYWRRLDRYH